MLSSNTSAASGDTNYIEDVFSTYLYTGNSTSGGTQTITNNIDLSTKGGMVWIKGRSAASNNMLYDTVRGAGTGSASGSNKALSTNSTGAEGLGATSDYLSAFSTSGFSATQGGATAALRSTNYNAVTYASWTFRKQPKFFDVVTYTGTGTTQNIAHNLGSVPGCIMIKSTSNSSTNWIVYHRGSNATPQNYFLYLNGTQAAAALTNAWNNTAPTSTEFTVGNYTAALAGNNTSGQTYVAYLFAHDAGGFGLTGTDNVISCGSYTGNGSATGPTVTLGYEPQLVLIKNATSAGYNWTITDNMRGFTANSSGGTTVQLLPNTTAAEANYYYVQPQATGFQVTDTSSGVNGSGDTYIYIAIRRGPMKVPTDATKVFSPVATTFAVTTTATTNFPVDLVINTQRTKATVIQNITRDRLRGEVYSTTTGTAAEATTGQTGEFASNTSYIDTYTQAAYGSGIVGTNAIYWNFRRAPNFFDEVCYTGTGANTTQTHNLGVVPELILVKRRDGVIGWYVYSAALANTEYLVLNTTAAKATGATLWNSTTPTSTVFSIGTSTGVNASAGTYLAYLFATCSGVSKVGSYTGTGTTLQVDCGFAAGARFVLIKRTDSTGDWYVWDSARGIVSGNDPYLALNSAAIAEVTTTDYIDPYSAGFEISSTAPAAINASGGTFIFLAIA